MQAQSGGCGAVWAGADLACRAARFVSKECHKGRYGPPERACKHGPGSQTWVVGRGAAPVGHQRVALGPQLQEDRVGRPAGRACSAEGAAQRGAHGAPPRNLMMCYQVRAIPQGPAAPTACACACIQACHPHPPAPAHHQPAASKHLPIHDEAAMAHIVLELQGRREGAS